MPILGFEVHPTATEPGVEIAVREDEGVEQSIMVSTYNEALNKIRPLLDALLDTGTDDEADILWFEQWSKVWTITHNLNTEEVNIWQTGELKHTFHPDFDGTPARYSRALRVLADLVEVAENEELGEEETQHIQKRLLIKGRQDAEKFWYFLQLWMDIPPAKPTGDDHWRITVPHGEHLEFYLLKFIREEGGKLNILKVLLPHEEG